MVYFGNVSVSLISTLSYQQPSISACLLSQKLSNFSVFICIRYTEYALTHILLMKTKTSAFSPPSRSCKSVEHHSLPTLNYAILSASRILTIISIQKNPKAITYADIYFSFPFPVFRSKLSSTLRLAILWHCTCVCIHVTTL